MLAERGVSGAPVLDEEGRLLGILTEGDLIRRLAAGTDKPRSWLLSLFDSAPAKAEHYARSHGRRVRDVMTSAVESVTEDTPVAVAAALLEKRNIRRLPVLRNCRLVGIVSRADLLKASLADPPASAEAGQSDAALSRAVIQAMRNEPWIDAYFIFPEVREGVVTFHGFCRSEEVQRGLRVLAEGLPGVRGVQFDMQPTPRFMMNA